MARHRRIVPYARLALLLALVAAALPALLSSGRPAVRRPRPVRIARAIASPPPMMAWMADTVDGRWWPGPRPLRCQGQSCLPPGILLLPARRGRRVRRPR